MINQLGKFSSHLLELSQPLRELLSTKQLWTWGPNQELAFPELKAELTRSTILALYDPQDETNVSTDASSLILGLVLYTSSEQESAGDLFIAYAKTLRSNRKKLHRRVKSSWTTSSANTD